MGLSVIFGEFNMKQFTKDLWVSAVNGFWGRALFIFVALIGVQTVTGIVLPENSSGDESSIGHVGIIGILGDLVGAFTRHSLLILVCIYWLLMEKMRVDTIKDQEQNETEIKKLELEKEILELQLKKESLQPPSKDDGN